MCVSFNTIGLIIILIFFLVINNPDVEYEYTNQNKTFKHMMIICCPFCYEKFIFEDSFMYHIRNIHFPKPKKQIQSTTAVNDVKPNLNKLLLLL